MNCCGHDSEFGVEQCCECHGYFLWGYPPECPSPVTFDLVQAFIKEKVSHIYKELKWYNGTEVYTPSCSCGWSGEYSHAAPRFAREDYDFHVQQTQKPPKRIT